MVVHAYNPSNSGGRFSKIKIWGWLRQKHHTLSEKYTENKKIRLWLKWESACLTYSRPWLPPPVPSTHTHTQTHTHMHKLTHTEKTLKGNQMCGITIESLAHNWCPVWEEGHGLIRSTNGSVQWIMPIIPTTCYMKVGNTVVWQKVPRQKN
jgi:hypothetical protein